MLLIILRSIFRSSYRNKHSFEKVSENSKPEAMYHFRPAWLLPISCIPVMIIVSVVRCNVFLANPVERHMAPFRNSCIENSHLWFIFSQRFLFTQTFTHVFITEGLRAKRMYIGIWANFHFLQGLATFWRTDLFGHETYRSVILSSSICPSFSRNNVCKKPQFSSGDLLLR